MATIIQYDFLQRGPTGPTGYTGVQGFQGEIGIIGFNGFQADQGPTGLQGFQGLQGILGFQGKPGLQGFTGPTGPTGVQGIQGIQGIQGNIGFGVTGPTGIQGVQGLTGSTGYQGIQGIQGETGSTGIQGLQGILGTTGIQGSTGSTGFTGIQGETGPRGIQGLTGLNGLIGFQGYQGETGTQGSQGSAGHTGSTGFTGIQGIEGIQGSLGFQGIIGHTGAQGGFGYTGIGLIPDMSDYTNVINSITYTATGSSQVIGTSNFYWKAFDSQDSEYWASNYGTYDTTTGIPTQNVQTNGYTGEFIQIYSSNSIDFNQFTIKDGPLASFSAGAPSLFKLFGSNDGSTWSQVYGQDTELNWNNVNYQLQTFNYTGPPLNYNYYRLAVGKSTTGNNGLITITRLQFISIFEGSAVQGSTGLQGIQGATGSTGTQGLQGNIGVQGTQGIQGFEGLAGSTGFQGYQGYGGYQGTIGFFGPQGFQSVGVQGYEGTQGSQGVQGITGSQGVQGFIPQTGATGYVFAEKLYTGGLTLSTGTDISFLYSNSEPYNLTYTGSIYNGMTKTIINKTPTVFNNLADGLNNNVNVIAFGTTGSNIYIGGDFTINGLTGMALFNGQSFTGVNKGFNNSVYAISSTGNYTFIGGNFTKGFNYTGFTIDSTGAMLYNGDRIYQLPGIKGNVNVIKTFSENEIYFGGNFTGSYTGICKFNNNSYQFTGLEQGTGFNGETLDIIFDQNNSAIIGGNFTQAGACLTANRIAQFTGGVFTGLGTGFNSTVYQVDKDELNNIYACGNFTLANGRPVTYFGRYDGSSWTGLGTFNNTVYSMKVKSSTGIYLGGDFTTINGLTVTRLAVYNGSSWTGFGSGLNGTAYDIKFDANDDLFVGGSFTTANGVTVNRIAKYDKNLNTFTGFATSGNFGVSNVVRTINFDNNNNLFIGGDFLLAGGKNITFFANYTGGGWTGVSASGTINDNCYDIYKDPYGNFILSGQFTTAAGSTANRIVYYDVNARTFYPYKLNTTNVFVGANNVSSTTKTRLDLTNVLHVTGFMTQNNLFRIARYNDYDTFLPVSDGIYGTINTMERFVQGNTGSIFLGGSFTGTSNLSLTGLAIYNITTNNFSGILNGLSGVVKSLVYTTQNTGSTTGFNLYIGGSFTGTQNTSFFSNLCRYDISGFTGLATGVNGEVNALSLINNNLFVGGNFTSINNVSVKNIAKFNVLNNTYTPFGKNIENTINTLTTVDTQIYAGGSFTGNIGIINSNSVINISSKFNVNGTIKDNLQLTNNNESIELFYNNTNQQWIPISSSYSVNDSNFSNLKALETSYVTDNLICNFNMNSYNIPTIFDKSLNNNSGTVNNTGTYSNNYLTLNATTNNQYVVTSNLVRFFTGGNLAFPNFATSISLCIWVLPLGNGSILGEANKLPSANWAAPIIEYGDGRFIFQFYGMSAISTPLYTFPAGNWYYVGITYDQTTSTMRGYVNGTCVAIGSGTRSTPYNTTDGHNDIFSVGFREGLGTYPSYLYMQFTELQVYNRSLTYEEILSNYISSKQNYINYQPNPISTNGLMFLVDANNSISNKRSSIWYDVSGYNNNINFVTTPTYTNNYLNISSTYGINRYITMTFPNGTSTWLAFVRLTASQPSFAPIIYSRAFSNSVYSFGITISGTTLSYNYNLLGYNFNGGTVPIGTWCMIGFVTYNNRADLYRNLSFVTDTSNSGINTQTMNFIGISYDAYQPSTRFNGDIGVCMIFNRALSNAEITQIYNIYKPLYGLP